MLKDFEDAFGINSNKMMFIWDEIMHDHSHD